MHGHGLKLDGALFRECPAAAWGAMTGPPPWTLRKRAAILHVRQAIKLDSTRRIHHSH